MKTVAEIVADLQRIEQPTAGLVRLLAMHLEDTARAAKKALTEKYAEDRGVIVEIGDVEIESGFALLREMLAPEYRERVERLLRDLTDARLRAEEYRIAVEGLADGDTLPAEVETFVRPLYRNVLASEESPLLIGAPFQSPDVVTPVTVLNQYEAFRDMVRDFNGDLVELIKESAGDLVDVTTSFGPYVLLGAAAIAAALYFRK